MARALRGLFPALGVGAVYRGLLSTVATGCRSFHVTHLAKFLIRWCVDDLADRRVEREERGDPGVLNSLCEVLTE